MKQKTKQAILFFSLLMVPFIWALSNSMILPILPRAQAILHISKVKAGLIITALSVPTAIFLPVSGFLSDRYGRVKIMVPTILLYGFAGLAAGIAAAFGSYPLIIIARCLQGIGATGTSLLALSYAGDLYQEEHQAQILSYLETSNSIGKLVSPLIGTLTAQLAWYGAFFVFPILAMPVASGLFLFQIKPECHRQPLQKPNEYFCDLAHLVKNKKDFLILASVATFVTVFLWFGTLFFLAELMEDHFRISPILHGFLLSLPVLVMTITTIVTGRYLCKFNYTKLIYLGLLIMGFTLLITLILPKTFMLYGMVALIGIGFGLILPSLNALVVGSVASAKRGVVTTFYGSVRALGSALGPLSFSLALGYGKTITLICAGSLALMVAVFVKLATNGYNIR